MKIGIIGAGAMGGAVARGLLGKNIKSLEISAANPSSQKLDALKAMGADVSTDNQTVARDSDIVILAVKPWLVEKVIGELHECIGGQNRILAVIAAGISTEQIAEWTRLPQEMLPRIMLVMPNTAMEVGQSMTFVVPAEGVEKKYTDIIVNLFNHLGSTMIIDEMHLPGATSLASCGIAYALRYVRAAVEGGVELGFKADAAQQIVAQTIKGAAELLTRPGSHAEAEIDKVTTPGGITIKGLNEMERSGFSAAVINGLRASSGK